MDPAANTPGAAAPSDADLLERLRAGDGAALDLLLERYEVPLFQFLVGLLRDHHQAEDALQETFVKALERAGDAEPDHLRGWLFTVAYRQAMLARRRQRRPADVPADALPAAADDPLAVAERRDEAARLRELLAQLPPSQQAVIRARFFEDRRFREIAADLGCPLNTALTRLHAGLARLRSLVEQSHD